MSLNSELDPLRRFVETPLRVRFCMKGQTFELTTNDECLTAKIVSQAYFVGSSAPAWRCRIIREDGDGHAAASQLWISTADLDLVRLDSTSFIICDRETREIFGFIGPAVSSDDIINTIESILIHVTSR